MRGRDKQGWDFPSWTCCSPVLETLRMVWPVSLCLETNNQPQISLYLSVGRRIQGSPSGEEELCGEVGPGPEGRLGFG